MKPRYLKSQLELKGRRLQELERQYGAVVQLKQAEPALCALYRIGLLYQRFARVLLDAPVPKELCGQRELVQEYRAQLASLAEAPQAKAMEGMEIAVAKSRELGVLNECARQAEAMLAQAAPDRHGPMLERLPDLPAASLFERPPGYGLLTAPRDWEAVRRAANAAAALPRPPVRAAAAPGSATEADRRPAAQPGDADDEDLLR